LNASRRFASTLVYSESSDGKLGEQTLNVITAATEVGGDVSVLTVGTDCAAIAEILSKVNGVSAVLTADDASYDHAVAENVTTLLASIQAEKKFSHIFFAETNLGKNIAPRLAAKMDVAPIGGITKVLGEDTFERTLYAGNAVATLKSKDALKIVTVRTTTFDKAEPSGGSATVSAVSSCPGDAKKSVWKADQVAKSDRPELTSAPVIIAGGRGMKSGENFEMLYKLADKMGAAVGASRAAVDAGYVANELQIGQTGKVVAPGLYIAVGISGAIQHLAGMKDSKTIVCINKDPEAPIFQVSDIGLEADLFKAVPEMTEKL